MPTTPAEAKRRSDDRGAAVPLVASYRTIAEAAADRGWLPALVDWTLDPESDPVALMSKRQDVWLRMRWRHGPIRSAFEGLVKPILAADWRVVPPEWDATRTAVKECEELTQRLRASPGFRQWLGCMAEAVFRGYAGVELRGRSELGGFGDVMKGEPLIPAAAQIPSFGITYEVETGAPRLLLRGEDPTHGVATSGNADWRWRLAFGSYGSTEGGNWYGAGLGLPLFLLYWIATENLKDWAISNKRYSGPIPIAEITEGNFEENKTRLIQMFKAMTANLTGMILPKGTKLTFAEVASQLEQRFHLLNEDIKREIRELVYGVADVTNLPNKGTYGAVRVQASQLGWRQWDVAQFLGDTATRELLPHATEYLYLKPRPYRLEAVFEDPVDPSEQRERVRLAMDARLRVKSEEVYRATGFTRPEDVDDELTLEPPAGAAPNGGFASQGAMPGLNFAEDDPKTATLSATARRKDLAVREHRAQEELLGSARTLATAVTEAALRPVFADARARATARAKRRPQA